MHLLFPGFFEDSGLTKPEASEWLGKLLAKIEKRLIVELEKSLRFSKDEDAKGNAKRIAAEFLGWLPDVRRVVQTDVAAAFAGDPAARTKFPRLRQTAHTYLMTAEVASLTRSAAARATSCRYSPTPGCDSAN